MKNFKSEQNGTKMLANLCIKIIRGFNLIRLMVILGIVKVGMSTPTNPVEIDTMTSNLADANSQFVPNQGFMLTKVSMFQMNNISYCSYLKSCNPGIKLTFSSCTGAQHVLLYGSDSLGGAEDIV